MQNKQMMVLLGLIDFWDKKLIDFWLWESISGTKNCEMVTDVVAFLIVFGYFCYRIIRNQSQWILLTCQNSFSEKKKRKRL